MPPPPNAAKHFVEHCFQKNINNLETLIDKPTLSLAQQPVSYEKPLTTDGNSMDVDKLSNLDKFRFICKDLPSPDLFIDYNFYFLVSSALARKVWIGTEGGWQLYPNLYLWFVGDPGIGKSMPAQEVSRILRSLVQVKKVKEGEKEIAKIEQLVNLAPNTTSWEKMIKTACDSGAVCKRIDNPEKTHYYHASTTFCLHGEVGTLLRKNTDDIGTFLTDGWDSGDYRNDTHKHGLQVIKNICINFLGCLAPKKMRKLESEDILDEGLSARILFLFAFEGRANKPALYYLNERQEYAKKLLVDYLKDLCLMPASEIKLSIEAIDWIEDWHKNKSHIHLNRHPILADYYARKKQHLIKLAMDIHFAEKKTYDVEVEDFIGALNLLERAEVNMHEARCCGGKNPVSFLAEEIYDHLKNSGPLTKGRILVDHFKDGNELQINEAISYLQTAGKVEPTDINGRPGYKYLSNPI